jgi:hypothetical protein
MDGELFNIIIFRRKGNSRKRQGGHKYINPYLKYNELLEQWIDGVW